MTSSINDTNETGEAASSQKTDGNPHSHVGTGQGLDIFAKLDEEIATLSRALLAAKRRRNQATLCHKLPPEIVSKILCHLAAMCPLNLEILSHERQYYDYPDDFDEPLDPRGHLVVNRLAWINVLQTCHYFREVGLSDIGLWTVIKFGRTRSCLPGEWASAFLSQSRSALLDVSVVFCVDDRRSSAFKDAMKEPSHASRIRTLFITEKFNNDVHDLNYSIHDAFKELGPMESLQSLIIEWSSFREDPIPVGRNFQAPQLSKLCVRGTMPNPSLPVYANLVHLELEFLDETDQDAGAGIASILKQTQRLQDFALRDQGSGPEDSSLEWANRWHRRGHRVSLLEDMQPLVLPSSVKRFQLHLNTDALCPVALKTVVPSHAAVDISVVRRTDSMSGLIKLAERYGCFSSAHPKRRAFLSDESFAFDVLPEDNDPLARRAFRISAELGGQWADLLPVLDLSAVHELYLGHERPVHERRGRHYTPMFWHRMFPHAHEIRHLVLPHVRADELVSALVSPVHPPSAGEADGIGADGGGVRPVGMPLFPALRKLTLTEIAKKEKGEAYEVPDMDNIKAALKEREGIEVVFTPGISVEGLWDVREGGALVEDDIFSLGEDRMVMFNEV